MYGFDGEERAPPSSLESNEPLERMEQPTGTTAEREGGILVNGEDDLGYAKEVLGDFDYDRDDGNWGIEVYCEAVLLMIRGLMRSTAPTNLPK
ncbi:hypothetical protein R3P38DRAFT_3189395 [Favolaschia claudopus]|uniref:Uncharacterized protein n=1 Tax=Favolaschia claudopus TaxID=2862362 RepID=A0AAW0BSB8_9AGAR